MWPAWDADRPGVANPGCDVMSSDRKTPVRRRRFRPPVGPKLKRPATDSPTHGIEEWVLRKSGLSLSDFARWKKLAPGGRRPLIVRPEQVSVTEASSRELRVAFFLPAGAYATVLLREVTKTPYEGLRPTSPS